MMRPCSGGRHLFSKFRLELSHSLTFLQLALLYTEAILIAQYVYQVPTRLQCPFVTNHVRRDVEFIGLHGSGPRGIPIFCVYLAILMHTYRIGRQQVLLPVSLPTNALNFVWTFEECTSFVHDVPPNRPLQRC